jgi:hypothetical protein
LKPAPAALAGIHAEDEARTDREKPR